ncbi:MAG: hypothetical protein GXP41_01465 [Chloroflexi bacterium]|nr:hypothetical protein [Chloroflexota bacterium]
MTDQLSRTARRIVDEHGEFLLLVLLFTAFRVLALILLRPGGFIYDYSDYHFFESFAAFSDEGFYPFVHYWMEYPPLFPWMAVIAYRAALHFPLWTDPRLAFYSLVGMELLPFEVGTLVLLYLLARRIYKQTIALRVAWIYALLFVPLYTWTGWFDTMPLFFLLATIYLLLDRRALFAGVALGIGFMSKVTPLLVFPVGWAVLGTARDDLRLAWLRPTRRTVRFVAGFLGTSLAIAGPFLWRNPALLLASFRSMFGRSSWETVWALLDGYYGYGLLGGNRFDPHPTFATHPTRLPWPAITIAFGLLYLALFLRARTWSEPKRLVAFVGTSLCLFLLYSKGYSPQFLIWVLAFLVLLLPGFRGVLYALLLSGANIVEWVFYFIVFPHEHTLLAAAVLLRTALIAALAVEFGVQYLGQASTFARARKWTATAFALLALGLFVVGIPHLTTVYATARLQANPYRGALTRLQARATPGSLILLTDDAAYRDLYPFLWREDHLRVLRAGNDLGGLTGGHDEVWLLRGETPLDAAVGDEAQRWLDHCYGPAPKTQTKQSVLRRYTGGC